MGASLHDGPAGRCLRQEYRYRSSECHRRHIILSSGSKFAGQFEHNEFTLLTGPANLTVPYMSPGTLTMSLKRRESTMVVVDAGDRVFQSRRSRSFR